MATPIPIFPPAPAVPASVEDLVLRYPEPALVFDHRCVCACLNDGAAQALGVNPDRAVGLGAVALGLPAEVAEAILAAGDRRRAGTSHEHDVLCGRGAGVRRYHLTPHLAHEALLLTWTDMVAPRDVARQTVALQETIRTLRERVTADGHRRREVLAGLLADLETTAAALRTLGEELTGTGWGLPPDRSAADVLDEESRRLRAVLTQLEQLDREPATGRTNAARDVIEL